MAAAKRCLEEGARVVISDTHERRLGETLETLRTDHGAGNVHALACNVTDEDQVQALIAFAVERVGQRVGQLPATLIAELDQALRVHLSL